MLSRSRQLNQLNHNFPSKLLRDIRLNDDIRISIIIDAKFFF